MSEPKILLDSWSPVCDIQAFVEETDQNCYFYLWFYPNSERSYIRACWICNTAPAEDKIDRKAMEDGRAPSMPAAFVAHDLSGIHLAGDSLEIVWLEEGDGAALLSDGKLICLIPGWADSNDFCGYSIYARGMGPFAWELDQALETLGARVDKSRAFWNFFESDYWGQVQGMHIEALEKFFGPYQKYYSIDGGRFPPKALVTGARDGVCYGITAGVSMVPLPQIEQYYQDETWKYRRIELGFASSGCGAEEQMRMYSFLSSLSAYPWQEISWLGHGHTVPCRVLEGYSAVWLLNSRLIPEISAPVYKNFMGEPVNLLWVVPVREEEYQRLVELGTEEILKRRADELATIHIFRRTFIPNAS